MVAMLACFTGTEAQILEIGGTPCVQEAGMFVPLALFTAMASSGKMHSTSVKVVIARI
jgi:hypothetical protein